MNFAAGLTLVGIDPFLSEEQALELRHDLEKEEQMIAGLDAEIAQAQAALESLKRLRDSQKMATAIIPSDSQVSAIRERIRERRERLEQTEKEIAEVFEAQAAIESLVSQKKGVLNGSGQEMPDEALEELHAELEQHRMHLRHLYLDRDQAQADLETQQRLLSPIRQIPLEILSEIFVHCLPADNFIKPSPADAPLLLAQICGRWRNVAISTPKIWSSISISVEKRCHPRMSLIETWIERSMLHPLSFRVEENIDPSANGIFEGFTGDSTVIDLFIPAYSRWKNVRIDYRDWRLDERWLTRIPSYLGSPPLLESLCVKRDYWFSDVRDTLRMLFSGPRLRTVYWNGILSGHSNPAELMPLELLQELHYENILTKGQFMRTLRSAPNLEFLRLSVFLASPVEAQTQDEVSSENSPMAFQYLKNLELVSDAADEQVFDALFLPALEVLKISLLDKLARGEESPRFWSMPSFKALHQRSGFALNTLDLTDTDILPAELLEVLRLCSETLQSLILANDHTDNACVDDEVLQSLTWSDHECLCPRLDYIKFWACTSSTDGLVAEMLASRWQRYRKVNLLKVALVMFKDDDLHPNDNARLQVLNKDRVGLTLLKRAKITSLIQEARPV